LVVLEQTEAIINLLYVVNVFMKGWTRLICTITKS